jgi:hypothetical protein
MLAVSGLVVGFVVFLGLVALLPIQHILLSSIKAFTVLKNSNNA